jgi:hypothetical protein
MATIRTNTFTSAFSGSIGNIVFRQLRGKTVVSSKPHRIKKQSEQQRENRSRFKCAAAWAKAQMLDADKKAFYWRMAKKLKLPNAYTAAVSDYMRKGEIKEIDTRQYKGRAGHVIKLKISKKDFAVRKVDVAICDMRGSVIETDFAIKKDKGIFIYKALKTINDYRQVRLRVMITDHVWNVVEKEMLVDVN